MDKLLAAFGGSRTVAVAAVDGAFRIVETNFPGLMGGLGIDDDVSASIHTVLVFLIVLFLRLGMKKAEPVVTDKAGA